MAQQTINVGASANDNTGDTLRDAFVKTQANFTDLYTIVGTPTDANTASQIVKRDASGNFSAGTITAATGLLVSAGDVGIGSAVSSGSKVTIGGTLPVASGNWTVGTLIGGTISSGNTGNAQIFRSNVNTEAAAFNLGSLYHFTAAQGTIGAGSTITSQGTFVSDQSLIAATTNYGFLAGNTAAVTTGKTAYGFYSSVNTATGGGTTWGFYSAGTANNYFAGKVGIGMTPSGTATFLVSGYSYNEATDTTIQNTIVNKSSTASRYPGFAAQNYNSTFAGFPVIELQSSRGSSGTPSTVTNGDILGGFNTWGHNGTAFQSATRIQGIAENTFSTAVSAGLGFYVTLAGVQTQRLLINSAGKAIFSGQIESTVTTGTAPLIVASTTAVTNLNADMLDGAHVGTSGATIPLLSTTNTWSNNQTFTGSSAGAMVSATNSGAGPAVLGDNIGLIDNKIISNDTNGPITLHPNGTGIVTVYNSTTLGGTTNNVVRLRSDNGVTGNNVYLSRWLRRDATGTDWTTTRFHDGVHVDSSFATPGTDTKVWYERDPNNLIHEWGNAAITSMTLTAGATADTSALKVSGSITNSDIIKAYRPGSENSQYVILKNNDATGSMLTSYSAANNAKYLIINATTDVSNTAPSSGVVELQMQVLGVNRIRGTTTGIELAGDLFLDAKTINPIVTCATTADLLPATFSANVLSAYSSNTQTLALTTTAAGTTVTTTDTSGLRIGAIVSTATVQIAAGSTVDYNIDATSFSITPLANIATTAATGTGTTATLTFAAKTYAPYAVGATIVVSGVVPAGYNGTYTVTACTTTTVSYANVTTGAQTTAGTIAFTIAAGTAVSTTFSQALSALTIDGVTATVGMKVLVKDIATIAGIRSTAAYAVNGIYTVTAIGSTSVPWTLTRSTNADSITKLAGAVVDVLSGTTNGGRTFYTTLKTTDTLNTTQSLWYRSIGSLDSTHIAVPTSGVGFDFAVGKSTINIATGNVADLIPNRISSATITATGTSLYNRASTLYIQSAPVASDNVTMNARHAVYIGADNLHTNGTMTMGSLSSAQADFGPILTLGALVTAGSGYCGNGTYWDCAITSAITGAYALADVTVSGGAVTNVVLTHGGHRYKAGETLTVSEITFTTTSGSITGTSATLNFTKRSEAAPFTAGDLIDVTTVVASGATPTTCYQVTGATVTACTNSSVTYTLASAPSGTFTVTTQGTILESSTFVGATLTAATVQGSSLWINKYTSDSLGARIRLETEDTSVAADQEMGAIAFGSRDAGNYGSGDVALIRGRNQGTTGGGYIDFWTSQNGAPISGNVWIGRAGVNVDQYGLIQGGTTAYGFRTNGAIDKGVTSVASSFVANNGTTTITNGAHIPAFTLANFYQFYSASGTVQNGAIITGNHAFVAGSGNTVGTLNTGLFSNIPATTAGVAGPFTISNISSSGTTATITTSVAHGLTNGQTVTIAATANATALVSGVPVTILTLGTTDFTLIGATENTVGHTFTATGPATGGTTGTVTLNVQGSGKTVAGSSGSTFTITGPSATHTAVTVLSGTVTVSTRWNVYASGTAPNWFAGDIVQNATTKLRLDGATAGDTYITETSANVVDFFVGGANTLELTATGANVTGTLTSNTVPVATVTSSIGMSIALAAGMYL